MSAPPRLGGRTPFAILLVLLTAAGLPLAGAVTAQAGWSRPSAAGGAANSTSPRRGVFYALGSPAATSVKRVVVSPTGKVLSQRVVLRWKGGIELADARPGQLLYYALTGQKRDLRLATFGSTTRTRSLRVATPDDFPGAVSFDRTGTMALVGQVPVSKKYGRLVWVSLATGEPVRSRRISGPGKLLRVDASRGDNFLEWTVGWPRSVQVVNRVQAGRQVRETTFRQNQHGYAVPMAVSGRGAIAVKVSHSSDETVQVRGAWRPRLILRNVCDPLPADSIMALTWVGPRLLLAGCAPDQSVYRLVDLRGTTPRLSWVKGLGPSNEGPVGIG